MEINSNITTANRIVFRYKLMKLTKKTLDVYREYYEINDDVYERYVETVNKKFGFTAKQS